MKQPGEQEGPHQLPYGEQEHRAVEGRRIDGSGPCTVIAIRDRTEHGRVLYPHGIPGLGVFIADAAAHTLAAHTLAGRVSSPPHAAAAPFPDTAPGSTRAPEARHDRR